MVCVNVHLIIVAHFIRIYDNLIRLLDSGNVFIQFYLKVISGVGEFDFINNEE